MAWSSPEPLAFLDLDGTLCDPREGIYKGFAHAFDVLGLPCPEPARLQAVIGQPLLDCFHRLGVDGRSEEGARHFQAFFEGRGFAEAHLFDGVLDMLHALKADGWRLGLVTAKPAFAGSFVAERLGIAWLLDAGIHGCAPEDLRSTKAPLLSQALASHSHSHAFLLGDRDQDRDAAQACGIPYLAAGWGFGSPEEHAGAWAVAASPTEVLPLVRSRFALRGAP